MITIFRRHFLLILILLLFFLAYSTLGVIKHNNFLSGYDLGIINQFVWKYSRFMQPITTVHAYAFVNNLEDHFEIIYILISPVYWIWNDPRVLIILQSLIIVSSGIPVYLFAKRKKLSNFLTFSLLVNYLMFFGIQNAIWNDVHSLAFAAGFIVWFTYFLFSNNLKYTIIFYLLSIFCKEDIAFIAGAILFVNFLVSRKKSTLILFLVSVIYTLFLFFIYYPYLTKNGYIYSEGSGFFDNLNPYLFFDTESKRQSILYSFGWFGFLPLLAYLFILPSVSDFVHYFIFGKNVASAAEIFMHYRVMQAALLVFPAIIAISRLKRVPHYLFAVYLLVCALFLQYYLHLPLSYLSKSWFWHKPEAVDNINYVLSYIPNSARLVSQNNITPHVSSREYVYTLWSDVQSFKKDSPCGRDVCPWLRWIGEADYMIVDLSDNWDIRHMLQDNKEFILAVRTLEKKKIIEVYKKKGNAVLYKINNNIDKTGQKT